MFTLTIVSFYVYSYLMYLPSIETDRTRIRGAMLCNVLLNTGLAFNVMANK